TDVTSGVADFEFHQNDQIQPRLVFHNLSAFAQDSWKVSPRLTMTYGVRWEFNPPPSETSGHPPFALTEVTDLSTTAVASPGTPLWNATRANFAPRVGVSYLLTQNTERPTVLRAGFGIFYDMGTAPAGSIDD